MSLTVYNTHGEWVTLGEIRELEVGERGNYFPSLPFPDHIPCIWVCLKAEDCLYYEPEMQIENMVQITINADDILVAYDDNGGFLLLRPKSD